MELAKIDRTIRERVIRDCSLPLDQVCSEGERSELNDPVLFHEHIQQCSVFADSGACRTVYRITDERDLIPAAEVTSTDLLRLLVKEEVIHPQACVATRNAFDEIIRKADEMIATAVTRLTGAFCASLVNSLAPTPPKRHHSGSTFLEIILRVSYGFSGKCRRQRRGKA